MRTANGHIIAIPPPGPDRYKSIVVEFIEYKWWMARWHKNGVVCELKIDHEGQPTLDDVYADCEESVAQTWENQEPCPLETMKFNRSKCEGYYVYLVSKNVVKKEIPVILQPAEVSFH